MVLSDKELHVISTLRITKDVQRAHQALDEAFVKRRHSGPQRSSPKLGAGFNASNVLPFRRPPPEHSGASGDGRGRPARRVVWRSGRRNVLWQ